MAAQTLSNFSTKVWESLVPETVVQYLADHLGVAPGTANLSIRAAEAGIGGLVLWKLLGSNKYKLPPGPRPLPVLGNLMYLDHPKGAHYAFDELMQKYGDIVTIYFGPTPMVLLNTPELVREAFNRQGHATADRPYMYTFDVFSNGGKDIVAANDSPRLILQRKLAHASLRKYATANHEALQGLLESVFECLVGHIEDAGHLDPYDASFLVSYNILASMAFGKKFTFTDPFLQEMMTLMKNFEEIFTGVGLTEVYPILRYIPQQTYKMLKKFMDVFLGYIKTTYDEHMKTFDSDNLSDFTYHLINVMKEAEKDPDDSKVIKTLTDENFLFIIFDMFSAGTDTTRMTLSWIWTYLAAFPEVQKKAQDEVDAVLGKDGAVTVKSREQLPYVDAVLHEVMRIRPVTPSGVFHTTSKDIKLGGYDIPKGTILAQNIFSIHKDPRNWENPDAFLPERWLDENGKYVFQQNGFMPFSVGRRSCVGESFAKMELHMLTTMMLQKYTLEPQPGRHLSLEADNPALISTPKDQKLIARPRE